MRIYMWLQPKSTWLLAQMQWLKKTSFGNVFTASETQSRITDEECSIFTSNSLRKHGCCVNFPQTRAS